MSQSIGGISDHVCPPSAVLRITLSLEGVPKPITHRTPVKLIAEGNGVQIAYDLRAPVYPCLPTVDGLEDDDSWTATELRVVANRPTGAGIGEGDGLQSRLFEIL